MSGPSWSLWAVPVVAFAGVAVFVASVFLAERSQQRGTPSITPRDRWLAGGVFRGDSRAVSSREELPGPEELRSAQRYGPEEELPPRPGDPEREKRLAAKGG